MGAVGARRRFGRALPALVLLMSVAGCTIPDRDLSPTPYPIPSRSRPDALASGFAGRILVEARQEASPAGASDPGRRGLWQLTVASGNRLAAALVVPSTSANSSWAVSPDRHWLVYARGDTLVLRDLGTGQERQLQPGKKVSDGYCPRWSPDSGRLLVRNDDGPAVVTLDGTLVQLDTYKADLYTREGTKDAYGFTYHGEITCGDWLDPNRVVFDRLHALPDRVVLPELTFQIPADTTTVAVLSGRKVKLTDSATRWWPVDACGGWLAIAPFTGASPVHLLDHPTDASLTSPDALADNTAVADTSANEHGQNFGFQPGTCRPLYTQSDGVHAIDPATRSVQPGVLVPNSHSFRHVQWGPQPDRPRLAESVGGDEVELTDLTTGLTVRLAPDVPLSIEKTLAWLA
jgi:hypothetical protein